jgi:GNAT superfamily N-acetyltransferase
MEVLFRHAEREDTHLVFRFIKELAEFEKMSDEVVASEKLIEKNLFGEHKYAEVIFAVADGEEVGFVLFFHNFSTFVGRPGIYIEDLYVKPAFRSKSIGRMLMRECARLGVERCCGRMEWNVLNWNPARRFYEQMGAKAMDEWVTYRFTSETMKKLVEEQ